MSTMAKRAEAKGSRSPKAISARAKVVIKRAGKRSQNEMSSTPRHCSDGTKFDFRKMNPKTMRVKMGSKDVIAMSIHWPPNIANAG